MGLISPGIAALAVLQAGTSASGGGGLLGQSVVSQLSLFENPGKF
jgi:hypothetical protein